MASLSRFAVLVTAQLCVPAAVYFFVGLYNGQGIGLEYLLPNYLFMAAPHLLVSLLSVWPGARRRTLLWLLTLLNALLIVFQLWVLLAVPKNESALVWVLYIPFWGLALAVCSIARAVVRFSRRHKNVAPADRVGT